MSLGAGSSDRDRIRAGLITLAVGMLLLCLAAGMALMRGTAPPELLAQQRADAAANADAVARARAALYALLYGTLAVVALATFAYAIRRYRKRLLQRTSRTTRPSPTDTTDVWAMHRLPEDADPGEEGRVGPLPGDAPPDDAPNPSEPRP